MSTRTPAEALVEVDYPDSDGQPMAENTLQFRWIVTIQGGLDALFRDDPNVFVAGDLLWYPVEGDNRTRSAPDTMVVFGRPKGDRGSYMQWREAGIAPQVVFEVLSPGNRAGEMAAKRDFYERFGVQEYYILDPDEITIAGYLRENGKLRPIAELNGWVSPRLGIRFIVGTDLTILDPHGRPLESYTEVARQRDEANQLAERERRRADRVSEFAEQERLRAEQERLRAERLAAQLRALGMEPES
jgi:Uma2 family endonuclease